MAVIFIGIFSGLAPAEVLLEENWNTGAIDPLKWERVGSEDGTVVFDLGLSGAGETGDYALYLQDDFTYTNGLRSVLSFNRVADKLLVCSFTMFRDAETVPTGYEGPCGPWVDTNTLSGAFPALEQIEAGISRYSMASNVTYYIEGSPAAFDTVPLGSAFTNAFQNATNKNNALIVRVSLGPDTGAMLEWATLADPNNFVREFNTIGMPAGSNYMGSNMVSSADPVWVFFSGAGDGASSARAIVDDIKVETTAIPCLFEIPGDFTGDCKIDIQDFAMMAENWLLDCDQNPGDPGCVSK